MGTLIAAVASYLQALSNRGEWLLRIEDVDTSRRVPGADDTLMRTLDRFGFEWKGEVVWQSRRTGLYQQALDKLIEQEQVYPCTCSRKLLVQTAGELSGIYPGTCRSMKFPSVHEHAVRIRAADFTIRFIDAVAGEYSQSLARECGDFVVKRRDGLFAYQLAVVVDDAQQGITEVVRGADLLDSTPRQIFLQQSLDYRQPDYLHLPLLLDQSGRKLSKSEGAAELNPDRPVSSLHAALTHLGQQPPTDLVHAGVADLWQWASENWNIRKIPTQSGILQY
jgi:glutamyl-Q tRNA(Asp) synthetase